MRALSADFERRARYVLVPNARIHRPPPVHSAGGLAVQAHQATRRQGADSSVVSDLSKPVAGKLAIGSPFDPASPQAIFAETFGIRSFVSDYRIETGFGEPFDRSRSRGEMLRGSSLDAPAVKFSSLSPYPAKFEPSAKQKAKSSAPKAARTRKVKQKQKTSPVDALFRSIRRILAPPQGNKPGKSRSAKPRTSAD